MDNRMLLNHLYVPTFTAEVDAIPASQEEVGTVLANLAYFGFAPSLDLLAKLQQLTSDQLSRYWKRLLPALKKVTGDDRKMDQFVVYKNFPKEVLEMSRAQYWVSQILMYMGAPNEFFTQPEQEREPLQENLRLRVLTEAPENAYEMIFRNLMTNKARWTDAQNEEAEFLLAHSKGLVLDLSAFGFKENGLHLIALLIKTGGDYQSRVRIQDATDVLRLAAALSDQDISLRDDIELKRFKRSERRMLVAMLDSCKHLESDMVMRPALWKRFLSHLHPGDYKAPAVQKAYDALYNGTIVSYNAEVERGIHAGDDAVLWQVMHRPGDFARRLHKLYAVFGEQAIEKFTAVMEQLSTHQIVKLLSYINTINNRKTLVYAPRGHWKKAQVRDNGKVPFSDTAVAALQKKATEVIQPRLEAHCPEGVDLDIEALMVKLQTNDQKLASYGRGTVFKIPDEMTFIRTASYWACESHGNNWFDNGFVFFDEHWNAVDSCVWNDERARNNSAIFSGDPTNSKDMKGRACQMIDLYLDKLENEGVRYAIWSVLCFSNIPFGEANDVLATLQWGDKPQKGKLYEPARAQMIFPLKGDGLTRYVAYIDLKKRELVFMDADLGGSTQSMANNIGMLAERMPAYLEYLDALPSVYDLFVHAPEGDVPVVYSDLNRSITEGKKAYVFRPENAENNFTKIDIETVLSH